MNEKNIATFVDNAWDQSIVPTLMEYIKIPNKSPAFDADWETHGYMDQAMELIRAWCETHALPSMQMEVLRLPGRTPLLFIEIPGQTAGTVLLYGHMDKQPEMTGWEADLGPWKPVLREDKLYGRGAADDGYAAFASLTAIRALQEQGIPHPRAIILIEASEESGSMDLPPYIDHLKERIGEPDLIICLDSGAANYKQLWVTTSLRGVLGVKLSVQILKEGVHSGIASGIVPDSFQILRELLDRVEDAETGQVLVPELTVDIPQDRREQAKKTAAIIGQGVIRAQPFVEGAEPLLQDPFELILNRTWKPSLTVIGMDDIPSIANAGNVLRPKTTVKLSFRIPPTCKPEVAAAAVKKILEDNPPYNAYVHCEIDDVGPGWNAPSFAPWLEELLQAASNEYFGAESMYLGEGASIPFMGMLGEIFPRAQFVITGVLGPKSNAHGPNEFLHIPTGKKLTSSVAYILAKFTKK